MDKESRYLLQKIDCNCNDCKFMVRDLDRLKQSKQSARDYYAWSYRLRRFDMWNAALVAKQQGKIDRYKDLLKRRARISLDTSYKSRISYGNCTKFDKRVSFIANTCQIETQECFVHRRD